MGIFQYIYIYISLGVGDKQIIDIIIDNTMCVESVLEKGKDTRHYIMGEIHGFGCDFLLHIHNLL